MAGIVAVEIFAQDLVGALADAPAQRFTDADALSRNPKTHFCASLVDHPARIDLGGSESSAI
jgi:hypothetical protein